MQYLWRTSMRNCHGVTANVKANSSLALTKKTTSLWEFSVRVTAVTAKVLTYCFQFIFLSNYFFSKNNRDFSLDNKTKPFKAPFYGAFDLSSLNKISLDTSRDKTGANK